MSNDRQRMGDRSLLILFFDKALESREIQRHQALLEGGFGHVELPRDMQAKER